MAATTITTDDDLIAEELAQATARPRVSWGAIFVGAVVAVATTLFLLLLGSGIGLALVNPARPAGEDAHFLTLGAIFFVAAQAFGLALGAHLTGRLIGPALETDAEEEFRAGAHGLAVWGLAVVATAVLVALSGLVAENAAINLRAAYGSPAAPQASNVLPGATQYWVDTLFRPSSATAGTNTHASLDGVQYAQNDTGTETDASPTVPQGAQDSQAPSSGESDTTAHSSGTSSTPRASRPSPSHGQTIIEIPPRGESSTLAPSGAPVSGDVSTSTLPPVQANAHDVQADKAEAGRILNTGMAHGGFLSPDDRGRLAELVAQDANISYEAATARANDVQSRIHNAEVRAADTARKVGEYASLWTALALLFGAIVATVAAISARWEDDAQQMFVLPWAGQH